MATLTAPEPELTVDSPHARVATRPLERVLPYLLVAPVMIYIFVILILPILIEILPGAGLFRFSSGPGA